MDDKIYRGPGHPVGAHFHSGPKGERGLPGVSPKVDMTYNEDDGAVVFTVSDGYGQREQAVPVSERIDEWTDEHGHEAIDAWLDDHPEATTTVEDGSITVSKLHSSARSSLEKGEALADSGVLYQLTAIPQPEDANDGAYYLGGCAVTNDSIVFAMATSGNTKAALYAIDKDDYSEVTSTPVAIDSTDISAPHCNSMTYVPSTNELWVKADYYKYIVIDGTTLQKKRLENIPYPGYCAASSFDPVTEQWVYICYNDVLAQADAFEVHIHDKNGNVVRDFSIDRVSTAQDCTYYDGFILLELTEQGQASSYQSEYNANMKGAQNILVFDDYGNILRSWWYSKDYKEMEGISILTDGRAVVSTKQKDDDDNQIVYVLPYKNINDTMALREYDKKLIIPVPASSIPTKVTTMEDDISTLFGIKSGWMQGDVPFLDLDAAPNKDSYGAWWLNCSASGISGTKPESSGQGILFVIRQSTTTARQMWVRVNGVVYNRQYNITEGTWGAWTSSAST